MFSLPPRNHFANGSSHSSVWVNGSFQVTVSRAIRSQKATGSRAASSYSEAWALACALNAGSGGKVRPSARRFSISGRWSTLTWASPGGDGGTPPPCGRRRRPLGGSGHSTRGARADQEGGSRLHEPELI